MLPNNMSVADLSEARKAELRTLADRSPYVAVFLGLFVPPIAYVYIGKYRLAALNFITMNYFMLGLVIVPLQTRNTIVDARRELIAAGVPPP